MKTTHRYSFNFASILLCTALILSSFIFLDNSVYALQTSLNNWRNKIDKVLALELETMSQDEVVPVYLWLEEIDQETISNALLEEKGMSEPVYENESLFNKEIVPTIISNLSKRNATSKETSYSNGSDVVKAEINKAIDEYVTAKREIVKREYTNANDDFISKNINNSARKIIYKSNFTSTIIVEASKAEIEAYAKNDKVKEISLFIEYIQEPSDDISLNQIFADSSIGTKSQRYNYSTGYKGEGVKIGILEAGAGRYDSSSPQLSSIHNTRLFFVNDAGDNGQPITRDGEVAEIQVATHATMVTSIIVGQSATLNNTTYEGVAPQATVYQTPIIYNTHVYNGIQRLVEKGCYVINYSGGSRTTPAYTDYDQEVDRLIKNTGVVFVNATGNVTGDNSENIISPGKAFNAIVVGNAMTKSSASTALSEPFDMKPSSLYQEASYVPNKPDLVAPGTNITCVIRNQTSYTGSGSSYAAPMVTGVVAQMMEANPTLRTPAGTSKVKSMLLAGAQYSKISTENNELVGNYLREKSGAGLVNAVNSVNIANNINSQTNEYSFNNSIQSITQSLGTLTGGQKVRLVMTFYKSNTNLISSASQLDDINISLINQATNTVVSSSTSNINNVEIIEFTIPDDEDGHYQYLLTTNNLVSADVKIDVTWVVWRPGDVNFDGATDDLDATTILRYDSGLSSLTPESLHVADVNKDGLVDNTDATLILQYYAGLIITLQ